MIEDLENTGSYSKSFDNEQEEISFMVIICSNKNENNLEVHSDKEDKRDDEVDLEGELLCAHKEIKRLKIELVESRRIEEVNREKLQTKENICQDLEIEVVGLRNKVERYHNGRLEDLL